MDARYNIRLAGPYVELYKQLKAEGHNVALVTDAGQAQRWDPGYDWSYKADYPYITVWDGRACNQSFLRWVAKNDSEHVLVNLSDQ